MEANNFKKTQQSLVKVVDIAFNDVAPQRNEIRFSTKFRTSEEDFIVLRKIFINHDIIDSYIRDLAINKNMGFEEIVEATQHYISDNNLIPNIKPCWYTAARKISNLHKKGHLSDPSEIKYLSLTASKPQNDNFTITGKRDKVLVEGINVLLILHSKVPEEVTDNGFFYMNISCSQIDRLEGLQVSFHTSKNK